MQGLGFYVKCWGGANFNKKMIDAGWLLSHPVFMLL